jgi:Na+-transporting NADH:ubiquinone oxidoreductase subunit F
MNHANRAALEYYLCGPPLMIKATTQMLHGIGVDQSRISFDEF